MNALIETINSHPYKHGLIKYLNDAITHFNQLPDEECERIDHQGLRLYLHEIAPVYGGIFQGFLDCENSNSAPIPPKLVQLIKCVIERTPPDDNLSRYAASPLIWPGMTMIVSDDLKYACQHGNLDYLRWLDNTTQLQLADDHALLAIQSGNRRLLEYINEHIGYSKFEYLTKFEHVCQATRMDLELATNILGPLPTPFGYSLHKYMTIVSKYSQQGSKIAMQYLHPYITVDPYFFYDSWYTPMINQQWLESSIIRQYIIDHKHYTLAVLNTACYIGDLEIVKNCFTKLDHTCELISNCIKMAQKGNQFELVMYLSTMSNTPVTVSMLLAAGNTEEVKALMSKITPTELKKLTQIRVWPKWLSLYICRHHPEIGYNRCVTEACRFGDLKLLEHLLATSPVKIKYTRNKAFRLACANGHEHIIDKIISTAGCCNITAYRYQAIRSAYRNGHLNIVNKLVAFGQVPTAVLNQYHIDHF